jgi:DnaJ family protein C protein 2
MVSQVINVTLPALPQGWSAEKDFTAVGTPSATTQRNLEPVGPHFLAHARRKRHHRTFSEDERIQAQQTVKKTEDDDDDEISEPEDPMMLSRDAKDWKVRSFIFYLTLKMDIDLYRPKITTLSSV